MLPAFVAGGASLVWNSFATAWTYAILAVPILLLPAVLARRDDPVLRAAFEASVSGTGTFRATVFFDESGDVIREQQFIRAPSDLWTNTTTGKTIEVRAEFQQTYTWVPERGEYTVTVVGHRYLANEPGSGVTVQEVGRIVYADPSEQAILTMAGQHDLAQATRIEPVFCGRLA